MVDRRGVVVVRVVDSVVYRVLRVVHEVKCAWHVGAERTGARGTQVESSMSESRKGVKRLS